MLSTPAADLAALVIAGVFAADLGSFSGGLEERLPMAPMATMALSEPVLGVLIGASPLIQKAPILTE